VPQLNILNAGQHADSGFEVQETMILPVGAENIAHAMEMGTDVWYQLKSILKKAGFSTGRGDEGGFVNPFRSLKETIETVLEAIETAGVSGYKAGKDIMLGFDGAFSEIYGKDLMDKEADPKDLTYHLGGKRLSPEDVVEVWKNAVRQYPIISIEDGMAQNDKVGWQLLTNALGKTTQLVLDDYICTNTVFIRQAINDGIGNASLIKLNQVGTVSETNEAMELTRNAGRVNVISHRSGETEDDFIAHMAMSPNASQIKTGSSGADRMSKYNALIRFGTDLGAKADYLGLAAFPVSVQVHWRNR
jgi:enolase